MQASLVRLAALQVARFTSAQSNSLRVRDAQDGIPEVLLWHLSVVVHWPRITAQFRQSVHFGQGVIHAAPLNDKLFDSIFGHQWSILHDCYGNFAAQLVRYTDYRSLHAWSVFPHCKQDRCMRGKIAERDAAAKGRHKGQGPLFVGKYRCKLLVIAGTGTCARTWAVSLETT